VDIVKRAYLKTIEEMDGDQDIIELVARVRGEVERLIRVRAYSGRDWPKEFGPLPDELRSKRSCPKSTAFMSP